MFVFPFATLRLRERIRQMLTEYAKVLMRRWWLVAIPPLVILALTLLTTRPAPPVTYQVSMAFSMGISPEPAHNDTYNFDRHYNWLASEYITQGFSLLIPKGEFAAGVERQLAKRGIALPAPVAGSLRSEYRSSVMTVYVNWPTAEQAAQIAQGVVDELTENFEAYWPQLKDAESPPARLMDPIVPVPIAPALRDRFDLPVRIVLGLLAGVALAVGWHFLDPAVRGRSELERMGLNVVAEIPSN
jgi:capsular polysaccharide biosynthesis protein